MKKALAIAMAALMVFGMTACGSKDNASQGSSNDQKQEETGGEATPAGSKILKVFIETEVQSLDPQVATDGTSFEVIADMTDGLYQMDADGNPIPALAEKTEVSEDGKTYTFTLRDAKWSNGTPVTADDFVYGWQRACDPNFASEYSYMIYEVAQVKNGYAVNTGELPLEELGVKALDEKTLQVELEVPVAYFLSLLYFPTFYPVNREFCEATDGKYGTSPDTFLCNGAFLIQSDYAPAATSFTLLKNPEYWDADRVQLDGLSYQVIKDSQTALLAYQNGELDTVNLSGEQVEQVQDDPEFSAVEAGYLWYVTVNVHDVDFLANLNMRKALRAAFDRQAICDTIVKDGSTPAYFAVPEGLAVGPDGQDFRATAETFDLGTMEQAQEYYAAACEELGRNSFDIDLLVEDDATAQNIASYIAEQWNKLPGVNCTLTVKTKKQRVKDIQDGNYQTCITRWGPDYADPMTYLNMWITDNNNNYGRWSSADYDAIVMNCINGELAADQEARWDALHDAEEIIMDQAVILPIYQKCNAMMTKSNVHNIECHSIALNRVYKNTTMD